MGEITRAANMFGALGVTRDAPVAFVLPNLPETHFTIWGGEAVGVACGRVTLKSSPMSTCGLNAILQKWEKILNLML